MHRYHERGQGERRAWVGPVACASEDVQAWIEQEDVAEGERLLYVALTRAKGLLILPKYVVGETKPKGQSSFNENGDPKGPYGCVNRRLRAVLGTPLEPKTHPRIQLAPSAQLQAPEEGDLAARFADWNPGPPPDLGLPDFHALAVQGRPVWLWSYTGLQKGFARLDHRDEAVEAYLDPPETASSGSRGGAKLGSRVHACFQQVELDTFDGREFGTWQQDPLIQALAKGLLPPDDQEAALAWIYAGLGGALPLPDGGSVTVARAKPILRELDFMTPYPGCRDLLHGSMDVLFQWEGKTYLLDWKTNRLEAYDAETLQRKMDEDYLLQVKVYTLTACRFLGIASAEAYERGFGGVLYVFLRGLPDGGVWTLQPSWSQVKEWEKELEGLSLERLIPVHAGGAKDA